jgi:hypothetical protein
VADADAPVVVLVKETENGEQPPALSGVKSAFNCASSDEIDKRRYSRRKIFLISQVVAW